MDIIQLSEKMTTDILMAVGKTDDPVKPIVRLYIEKKLQEFLDNYYSQNKNISTND